MFGLRIARGKTMGMRNHDEAAGPENNEWEGVVKIN
jgi:hypothetical protein